MAKTILIVEDNSLNMKVFVDLLAAHGYATICAEDGEPGLALARRHQPDLILMDIQLRDISGLEVTRRIRADPQIRDTPIIAVTAFAMRGDAERMLAGGCNAYVAKPINAVRFLATIREMIGPPGA